MSKSGSTSTPLSIKNNSIMIFFLLFLLFFPPLPRVMFGIVFKWEFLLIILFLIFLLLKMVGRGGRTTLKLPPIKCLFIWLGLVFFGCVLGYVKGYPLYEIVKDTCYFITPLMVFLLMKNYKGLFREPFYKALFKYGTIVSVIQIILISYGLFKGINRYTLRHLYLIFSTELIPLIAVFRIIITEKIKDKVFFLYIATLIITLGRADFLFIVVFLISYFFIKKFKSNKIRLVYLLFFSIGFTALWLIPFFFPDRISLFGSSIRWRYQEWFSYFDYLKDFPKTFLLYGFGLGASLPALKPKIMFTGIINDILNRFHNIFLFFIFKLGLLGMIFYFFITIDALRNYRFLKNDKVFWHFFLLFFYLYIIFPVHGGFVMSISQGIIFGTILFLIYENSSKNLFGKGSKK